VHLPVPAPHLPALHVPALRLTGRVPVAAALLSVVYATAIAVAMVAPGQHALAGCAVLAGLVSRSLVRRRRSAPAAVGAAAAVVDSIGVVGDEGTARAASTA
jgi:hypothetical protein